MTTIWHNPRCSTSRATLALLEERGQSPALRLYLTDPPDAAELRAALAALGLPAIALVRHSEPLFTSLGLAPDTPDDQLVAAMARHPILIQRPLVLHRGRAALGRPPEAVLALF